MQPKTLLASCINLSAVGYLANAHVGESNEQHRRELALLEQNAADGRAALAKCAAKPERIERLANAVGRRQQTAMRLRQERGIDLLGISSFHYEIALI